MDQVRYSRSCKPPQRPVWRTSVNYHERVTSVRLEITTQQARKESDGEVRLQIVGARRRWTIKDRWIGDGGLPSGEWVGHGTRWYKDDPPQYWRNDLVGLQLTIADFVEGWLTVDFRNLEDSDDTWGFDLRLVALSEGGEVTLVYPAGQPRVLRATDRLDKSSTATFRFALPSPPPPPQPPDVWPQVTELIAHGRCREAEGIANEPQQLVQVAYCYAQREEHADAARVASAASARFPATDTFSAGNKLLMRDLANEQKARLKVRQRNWQSTRFVFGLPTEFHQGLSALITAMYQQWETYILEYRNRECFGPIRLERQAPVVTFRHQPLELGPVLVLQNRSWMTIELKWSAYDFVKRYRKDDEYSNGQIRAAVVVVAATSDTDLLVDVAAPGIGDIDMSAEAWNPEFNMLVFAQSLIALATGATFTPNIHIVTLSLEAAVRRSLPWLPEQLMWTLLSLELRENDCIVGAGFGRK
jgi:hypothetical protein